jgi:glutamate/tyrosine decarboxylase-like PLP-dependent enzyme
MMNYETRQIGFEQTTALTNLDEVVREWIVPFLNVWVNCGPQPLASAEDIQRVQDFIQSRAASRTTPDGYSWLPDLLNRLAGAMRFNAQNFVNIHPTPLIPAIVAGLVASIQNPNNIVRDVSEATTTFEEESIRWMSKELVGFEPDKSWGNVVSGGTVANMTALLVARDYSYRKLSRPRPADVRTRGLFGLPAGVVLATAGSHYSIKKAMWFLGMGDENVVRIPVAYDEEVARRVRQDGNFVAGITHRYWRTLIETSTAADRERGAKELAAFYSGAQEPFSLQPLDSEIFKALYSCFEYGTPLIAYVFTLGTTDTGTIEKPNHHAIRRLVKEDIFIHADAALGGFSLNHPRVQSMISELEKVHSVTIDGHKLGHLAYPNGAVLFRDVAWRQEIMHEAPYLRDLAPTLEGSRSGTSSAALWAAIQDLGKNGGYVSWLDRLFAFVDRLKQCVAADGSFQVLHDVHLTTLAIAPVLRPGETRSSSNAMIEKLHRLIASDTEASAYLVNIDRGLAGIKVRNSNEFLPFEDGNLNDEFVDIYCLRLVAANPAVEPSDAERLLAYLLRKLHEVRRDMRRE